MNRSEIRIPSTQNTSPSAVAATIKLPAPVPRNLPIGEKILQLDRTPHANRLKPVPGLPVPQLDNRPDLVRIKTLISLTGSVPRSHSP